MAPRPAEIMWERYRKEVLPEFEDGEPATGLARAAFYSGLAMALAYFFEAGKGSTDEFTRRMEALENELDETALEALPVSTTTPQ